MTATTTEYAIRSKRSGKLWHRTDSLVEATLMVQALRRRGVDLVSREVTDWTVLDTEVPS